jgi:3-deoxy-7-phosphoheptulonate synthase
MVAGASAARPAQASDDSGADNRLAGASLVGAMLESNLLAGSQKIVPGVRLQRGISVTDACIGWEETRASIRRAADQLRRLSA